MSAYDVEFAHSPGVCAGKLELTETMQFKVVSIGHSLGLGALLYLPLFQPMIHLKNSISTN